jgi:hypothetical protein
MGSSSESGDWKATANNMVDLKLEKNDITQVTAKFWRIRLLTIRAVILQLHQFTPLRIKGVEHCSP